MIGTESALGDIKSPFLNENQTKLYKHVSAQDIKTKKNSDDIRNSVPSNHKPN